MTGCSLICCLSGNCSFRFCMILFFSSSNLARSFAFRRFLSARIPTWASGYRERNWSEIFTFIKLLSIPGSHHPHIETIGYLKFFYAFFFDSKYICYIIVQEIAVAIRIAYRKKGYHEAVITRQNVFWIATILTVLSIIRALVSIPFVCGIC